MVAREYSKRQYQVGCCVVSKVNHHHDHDQDHPHRIDQPSSPLSRPSSVASCLSSSATLANLILPLLIFSFQTQSQFANQSYSGNLKKKVIASYFVTLEKLYPASYMLLHWTFSNCIRDKLKTRKHDITAKVPVPY